MNVLRLLLIMVLTWCWVCNILCSHSFDCMRNLLLLLFRYWNFHHLLKRSHHYIDLPTWLLLLNFILLLFTPYNLIWTLQVTIPLCKLMLTIPPISNILLYLHYLPLTFALLNWLALWTFTRLSTLLLFSNSLLLVIINFFIWWLELIYCF